METEEKTKREENQTGEKEVPEDIRREKKVSVSGGLRRTAEEICRFFQKRGFSQKKRRGRKRKKCVKAEENRKGTVQAGKNGN